MAKVDPEEPGVTTVDTVDGVEVRIPAKVSVSTALFMMFFLFVWAVALIIVIAKLIWGDMTGAPSTLNLMIWLVGWVVGGALTISTLAWMLAGREIVRANVVELQYVRMVGLISVSREYQMSQIKRLRIFQRDGFGVRQGKYYLGGPWGGGTVAFDYGASTKRFGMGLDEAEALMVVEALTKRFRNLAAN